MAIQVYALAPCKLNVHLEVLNRRLDGYHELVSLFQLVSLADSMVVSKLEQCGTCNVVCGNFDLPLRNTITKAVDSFRLYTGIDCGVSVKLQKSVPSGAGLGGGSSDAAAMLLALNMLFDVGLSKSALVDCAVAVGSDVPFFLTGGTAIVTGRGESVRSVCSNSGLAFVIIWPEVFCSTGSAYGFVDEDRNSGSSMQNSLSVELLVDMYRKEPREWRFFNSFFYPVANRFPRIKDAADDLWQTGACFVSLTGSGSAVFGVFMDKKSADIAQEQLKVRWVHCYSVIPLDSYPLPERNKL